RYTAKAENHSIVGRCLQNLLRTINDCFCEYWLTVWDFISSVEEYLLYMSCCLHETSQLIVSGKMSRVFCFSGEHVSKNIINLSNNPGTTLLILSSETG
ncbi:MAG: hypothetical protein KKE17_07635, partial [Proteobacteria bacterium]|nr:hypothetical protein [Pseudomonadota bacterium]